MVRITRREVRDAINWQSPDMKPMEEITYRKPNRSLEHDIQAAIVKWLRMQHPNILVASSFNGAWLGGNAAIGMMRAKAGGLLNGWPDLVLHTGNGKTIYCEVKSEKGVLSDNQKWVHGKLAGLGIPCYVVRSVEDVRDVLRMECITS